MGRTVYSIFRYLHEWLDFYGFHVGKYTVRPMDPMSRGNPGGCSLPCLHRCGNARAAQAVGGRCHHRWGVLGSVRRMPAF